MLIGFFLKLQIVSELVCKDKFHLHVQSSEDLERPNCSHPRCLVHKELNIRISKAISIKRKKFKLPDYLYKPFLN